MEIKPMLIVQSDREAKSMPKLRDVTETSPKHRFQTNKSKIKYQEYCLVLYLEDFNNNLQLGRRENTIFGYRYQRYCNRQMPSYRLHYNERIISNRTVAVRNLDKFVIMER
jgi:hypothetical protein